MLHTFLEPFNYPFVIKHGVLSNFIISKDKIVGSKEQLFIKCIQELLISKGADINTIEIINLNLNI